MLLFKRGRFCSSRINRTGSFLRSSLPQSILVLLSMPAWLELPSFVYKWPGSTCDIPWRIASMPRLTLLILPWHWLKILAWCMRALTFFRAVIHEQLSLQTATVLYCLQLKIELKITLPHPIKAISLHYWFPSLQLLLVQDNLLPHIPVSFCC